MARPSLRAGILSDLKSLYGGRATPAEPIEVIPPHTIGPGEVRPGAIGGTHFYQVRNIIQIPFDDSLDSTYFLECFFQMPDNVKKISKARVWVQKKPFRTYNSAASSSSGSSGHGHGQHSHDPSYSTQADHSHGMGITGTQSATHTHDASSAETQNHTHTNSGTGTAGTHGGHVTGIGLSLVAEESPAHTHTISTSLTPGIFESGGTGNLTLYVSDDGTTPGYGAAIVGPTASDISNQDITSQLTLSAGDKRLKITASALMRVQVLLMLDLLIGVDPIEIGIT